MAVDPQDAKEIRAFVRGIIVNLRMNYGNAMALAGIEHNLIFDIHRTANEGMVEWLEANSD